MRPVKVNSDDTLGFVKEASGEDKDVPLTACGWYVRNVMVSVAQLPEARLGFYQTQHRGMSSRLWGPPVEGLGWRRNAGGSRGEFQLPASREASACTPSTTLAASVLHTTTDPISFLPVSPR